MTAPRIRPSILFLLAGINTCFLGWYFLIHRPSAAPIRVHSPAATSASFGDLGLPDFLLINSSAHPVTRADFLGRPWVFDFIYTDCPAQCPMMTTKMSALRRALPESVGFASVSVNPAKDSPAVLSEYARRYGAQNPHWLFLTGSAEQIAKLQAGLGAPAGSTVDAHSVRFYLVDRKGRLAGAYDTTQEKALGFLSRDAKQLAGESE